MWMRGNTGLRRYRPMRGVSGMGQAPLNCPGDPACPGYIDPYQNLATLTEGVLSGQNVIVSTEAYNQMLRAGATATPGATLKQWTPLIIGGLAVVVLMGMLGGGGGGRRR